MKIIFLFFLIYSQTSTVLSAVQTFTSTLPEESIFNIPKELQGRVNFWVKVYSEISENEGLLHNLHYPEIIYKKLSFNHILKNKLLTDKQKRNQIDELVNKERKKIAIKYSIANDKQIRLQTGLKERTQKAFYDSGKYLNMMEDVFKKQNLPIELTRLVFVESSFNIKAQSKVGASGLWQIMPSVAKQEGYIHPYYDKRNHPYYSTVLAASILKHNYKKTNDWGLGITAYNHGLAGIMRMSKLNKTKNISELIKAEINTKSWGFASENFYACFLAMLKVEKNLNHLFDQPILASKPWPMNRVVLKKNIYSSDLLAYFQGDLKLLKNLNPHLNFKLLNRVQHYPKGTPIVLPTKVNELKI